VRLEHLDVQVAAGRHQTAVGGFVAAGVVQALQGFNLLDNLGLRQDGFDGLHIFGAFYIREHDLLQAGLFHCFQVSLVGLGKNAVDLERGMHNID
jgi:hypothetical protein